MTTTSGDRSDADLPISRTEASGAVEAIGWRYLLGTLCASVPVVSLLSASSAARTAIESVAPDGDAHLRIDLRPRRVELSLQTRARGAVTRRDTDLAHRISAALNGQGFNIAAPGSETYPRPVAALEVAIDAMDIPAIRPFWKAALNFVDDPADSGPTAALVDPAGQLPALWFQQMDKPRPQRNRIHLDVTVAHDEAEARVSAALSAGGRLVNDAYARMFWVLADAEGNECCICTWLDRDEWESASR